MERAANAGGLKKLLESAGEKAPRGLEDELQNIFRMPLFELVGLKVEKAGGGRCEISFGLAKEGQRQGEMMHGGITMFALDNAASMAVMTLNNGVSQSTLELKVNFLSPVSRPPFRARGEVIKMGRSTAVAEARLLDAENKVCAMALGTWFIVQQQKEGPTSSTVKT
jgi:uncharacterized protein (TIGR00369 family)